MNPNLDALATALYVKWASPQIVEGCLGCLVGFFVVDGAGHVKGGVESVVVVPGVRSSWRCPMPSPALPIDWTMPRRLQAFTNASEVYWDPRSVWKITPRTLLAITESSQSRSVKFPTLLE